MTSITENPSWYPSTLFVNKSARKMIARCFWKYLAFIAAAVSCSSHNVIVILTDDQDVLLKSMEFLPKIDKLLVNKGTTFSNAVSS